MLFYVTQSDTGDSRLNKSNETSTHFSNATFEVSMPQMQHKESVSFSNDNDSSEKAESISEITPDIPINVTITDKKKSSKSYPVSLLDTTNYETENNSLRDKSSSQDHVHEESEASVATANNNVQSANIVDNPKNQNNITTHETNVDNETNLINKSEQLIKFDESIATETQINQNDETTTVKQNSTHTQMQTNNAQNIKRIDAENNIEKTVYFEEIIVDGKKQKVGAIHKNESLLSELPPLEPKSNSIFGEFPPLNGKKTNINDLKKLMNIGLGKSKQTII